MKTTNFKIADLNEIPEFGNLYSEQPVDDLITSIKLEGQLLPIQITLDGYIIDGYRRVQALKSLGAEDVLVTIRHIKPMIYDRILFNQYRIKTLADQVMEVKYLFKKFPKKQGIKSPNGESYKRDELIAAGLNNRFKGDKVIKKLEEVIKNDLSGDVLLKGILEKGWKVDTCHDFLTDKKPKDIAGNYGYTEKLVTGDISVVDANNLIKQMHDLERGVETTFKIPEKGCMYNMNCLDVAKLEEHKSSVDLLFTSPPYYILRKYQNGDPNQLGHQKTAKEFCEDLAMIINGLMPTLKSTANVMINIGETYDEGVGYGIPFIMKQAIEEHTPLIYKDNLIWSKPNPKPQNESVKRPINNVEYILWFVVDVKAAKYKMLTYPVEGKKPKMSKGARDIDKYGNVWDKNVSVSKPYGKIYSHLQQQEIEKIINCTVGQNHEVYKISSEGHPAIMSTMLPIVPILMTTDEGDTVFDPFGGSNVVGRISQLLNRRSITAELSPKYFKIACKMLEEGVAEYSPKELSLIQDLVYNNTNIAEAA